MKEAELNKLVELADDKRVLYIATRSEFSELMPSRKAKTMDVVVEAGTIWDIENVRWHIGEPQQIVQMFLPNFDLVIINGDNRFGVAGYDLALAYDKVGYGGTIAYYMDRGFARNLIEPFMAETHKIGKQYLPYHLYEVGDLTWFTVDWEQHKKVADNNMPATI